MTNCEKYKLKGVKLYTAEWRGDRKGYKLSDQESYKHLERGEKLASRTSTSIRARRSCR